MKRTTLTLAGARDLADVVAPEVHEHQVLGALLLVGESSAARRASSAARAPAPPRAGDRAGGGVVAPQAGQRLRRRPEDLRLPGVEVEHVGRGVREPERAVERDRRSASGPRPAAREHDLEALAGADLLPRTCRPLPGTARRRERPSTRGPAGPPRQRRAPGPGAPRRAVRPAPPRGGSGSPAPDRTPRRHRPRCSRWR